MGSTTRTNRNGQTVARRFIALFVLLLSTALFFTALPHLRAALNHISVDAALDRLDNKQVIDTEILPKLMAIIQADIALNDNARYWQDSSTLLFYQAQKQIDSTTLQQVKHSMEQSLARSPANAYLWYKLAVVHILLHQPAEKIAKILLMSIMTGPNELGYLLPRLSLCLLVARQFNDDDLDSVRDQILTAWETDSALFMMTFADDKKSMTIISRLLKDKHPIILQEMQAKQP